MNPPKRKYKQTKLKSFFFFLILAVAFWVLTKFSKEYDATVEAQIIYRSLPQEALLAEDNPNSFTFDLTANGFEFLFYKLNNPIINLNISQYYKEGQKQIIIDKAELTRLVTEQLEKKVAVKNLSVDRLLVNLNLIEIKKVPIVSAIGFNYKQGYKAIDSIVLKPDSVSVSGPIEFLNEIDSLSTKSLTVENVETNISGTVSINFPDKDGVTIKPREVSYSLEVAEFAQKKIMLPVTLINVPEDVEIKLMPKIVELTFIISVQNFNSVSAKDFKLVCDYALRNKDGNFMLPKLVTKPDNIVDVELDVKKIDFLTFK